MSDPFKHTRSVILERLRTGRDDKQTNPGASVIDLTSLAEYSSVLPGSAGGNQSGRQVARAGEREAGGWKQTGGPVWSRLLSSVAIV